MTVRVWVPATTGLLAQWYDARQLPARSGRAVTAALREAWPDGDDEDWEYAVLLAAADDSAALLDHPGRRVVVVVEADSAQPGEGTEMTLDAPVPWRRVAALHADPPGVRIAASAAADEAAELCWFGAQEVPVVLGDAAG